MKFEDKRKALEELGVSFAKPKHPEFSLVAKRYGSFSEWRYHQSPDSLARAGFYYTGKQIKRTNSYKIKRTSCACVMKELKEIYEKEMIHCYIQFGKQDTSKNVSFGIMEMLMIY